MSDSKAGERIEQVLRPWELKVSGVPVARVLPARERRTIGPVVQLERFGPDYMEPGHGYQVPPHPHRGLCTLTYPVQGEIVHRDSLGTEQLITPGEINWVVSGRGLSHSERSPKDVVDNGGVIDGVTLCCALPIDRIDCEPRFEHRAADELPFTEGEGWFARILAGTGLGVSAPTETECDLFLADVTMAAEAGFEFDPCAEERAVFGAEREATVDGVELEEGHMAILLPGKSVRITASQGARVLLIGGPPLDAPRTIRGNFVTPDRAAMLRAMDDQAAGRFPEVVDDPGDPKS